MTFLATFVGYEYDGAVMITASHLPFNRNGFKLFTRDGGFEKADIGQLLKLAAEEHAGAEAPNLAPGAAYEDDAFVLSCALHASPALIEYVRTINLDPTLYLWIFTTVSCQFCASQNRLRASDAQATPKLMPATGERRCAQVDFMPVYAAHLRTIIQKGISHPSNYERPLEGFHIIVDAGNRVPRMLSTL